jgi:hypothetical protein
VTTSLLIYIYLELPKADVTLSTIYYLLHVVGSFFFPQKINSFGYIFRHPVANNV